MPPEKHSRSHKSPKKEVSHKSGLAPGLPQTRLRQRQRQSRLQSWQSRERSLKSAEPPRSRKARSTSVPKVVRSIKKYFTILQNYHVPGWWHWWIGEASIWKNGRLQGYGSLPPRERQQPRPRLRPSLQSHVLRGNACA